MSIYNLMQGINPASPFIMALLGEKHPDSLPRFRDCFYYRKTNEIGVLTRVGGANRNSGYGEEELEQHPNFVRTYDMEDDDTYGMYIFSVPEEWQKDCDALYYKEFEKFSPKFKERLYLIYPKLHKFFDALLID